MLPPQVTLSRGGVASPAGPAAIFFFGPSSHVTSPSFNEYSYCTCAVRLKHEDLAGNTRLESVREYGVLHTRASSL